MSRFCTLRAMKSVDDAARQPSQVAAAQRTARRDRPGGTVPESVIRPSHRLGWAGRISHLQQPGSPMAVAVLAALVAILTSLGLAIRLYGLQGWDGTLTVDEARLAMAARGILEHGVPQLPSGWVYTRGLLATYLTAPFLALLGPSDFAVRLPAVLAGTALIPVGYWLGREVAGRIGGLLVVALLVGHPSLVVWSRQAWFYALYLLLAAAALLFLLRAARTGSSRDQLLAGLLVGLCAFAHEAGAFLLLPLTAQVGARVWQTRQDRAAWRAPVASLVIAGLALALLWLLILRLRADSLVGAYGEVDEYLTPALEWSRIRFYLRILLDGPGLLLAAALAGIVLAIRQRRLSTALLWLALAPSVVHAAFLIPRGPQERYGLLLIVIVAVLAAQGLSLLSGPLAALLRRLSGRQQPVASSVLACLCLIVVAAHQDVGRALDRAALSPKEGSWLRAVRELAIGPDAIVMTDVPTTVGWYVGGLDYWLSSADYEKYTVDVGGIRRDVHTGAVLVRTRGEFDRLVARPLAGQTVWVIASGRSYQWGELVDDDLKSTLDRLTGGRTNPGDNFRILVLNLPPGS
jgi:hypothetical protein